MQFEAKFVEIFLGLMINTLATSQNWGGKKELNKHTWIGLNKRGQGSLREKETSWGREGARARR